NIGVRDAPGEDDVPFESVVCYARLQFSQAGTLANHQQCGVRAVRHNFPESVHQEFQTVPRLKAADETDHGSADKFVTFANRPPVYPRMKTAGIYAVG